MLMGLLDATQREEPGTMLLPSSRVASHKGLPPGQAIGWMGGGSGRDGREL